MLCVSVCAPVSVFTFFPATYSSSFAHETFSKEFILRRPDGVRDSQRLKIVAARARQTRHLLISWYGIRRKKAVIRRKNFLFSPFTVSIKMSTLSQWFVSVCVALWRWKKNEDKKKLEFNVLNSSKKLFVLFCTFHLPFPMCSLYLSSVFNPKREKK